MLTANFRVFSVRKLHSVTRYFAAVFGAGTLFARYVYPNDDRNRLIDAKSEPGALYKAGNVSTRLRNEVNNQSSIVINANHQITGSARWTRYLCQHQLNLP